MGDTYVHGYDRDENARLDDQARALVDLLHATPAIRPVAGCSRWRAASGLKQRRSPGGAPTLASPASTSRKPPWPRPGRRTDQAGLTNVAFQQADVFAPPFSPESFDHVFVCFLLEHLSRPVNSLVILRQLLRPGGTITVIEGDHGSVFFHPDSADAQVAIQCLVRLQREGGGNALIGRQLHPMLVEARFDAVRVSPRMVYADASRPDLVDAFTRKTFTAMVEGVRQRATAAGIIAPAVFEAGVRALHRTTEADGVFCYTFFKGVGEKRQQVASSRRLLSGTRKYPHMSSATLRTVSRDAGTSLVTSLRDCHVPTRRGHRAATGRR